MTRQRISHFEVLDKLGDSVPGESSKGPGGLPHSASGRKRDPDRAGGSDPWQWMADGKSIYFSFATVGDRYDLYLTDSGGEGISGKN